MSLDPAEQRFHPRPGFLTSPGPPQLRRDAARRGLCHGPRHAAGESRPFSGDGRLFLKIMPKRARPGSVGQGPLYFLAGKHPRSIFPWGGVVGHGASGTQAAPGRAWLGPEPSCCRAQQPTTSLCSARLGQDGLRLCAHMCRPCGRLPVHATPTRRLLPITHRVSAGTGARFFGSCSRLLLLLPAVSDNRPAPCMAPRPV